MTQQAMKPCRLERYTESRPKCHQSTASGVMTPASVQEVVEYLQRYVERYHIEYKRFTKPTDLLGGGYPAFPISPYISKESLRCRLGIDGALIFDESNEPEYQWHIAGGPAIKVDYEPTRTPAHIGEILRRENLVGKPIGIYRIVAKQDLPREVWTGAYGTPRTKDRIDLGNGRTLYLEEYSLTTAELLKRATFGAFGNVLDIHLPSNESDFWKPHIIRRMGFFPADLNSRVYYNYLEVIPHRDQAAWDKRGIGVRVRSDVRRDFVATIGRDEGGSISFGETADWAEHARPLFDDPMKDFGQRLAKIQSAITEFKKLIQFGIGEPEASFHRFLAENSILLDVYGEAESKPKLNYSPGTTSPVGKTYLEPDFLIKYRHRAYKLVELERANKDFATQKGHPKQDFNQAAFQIGEWRNYIQTHYHLIKGRYPGINASLSTMIVMGRSDTSRFDNPTAFRDYLDLLKTTANVDDILTYEDLLERAEMAYARMLALTT
jgi:hypothetical protein